MVKLICITCPRGCHLTVDDQNVVSGNLCPKGAVYALSEINDSRRTVTTTVKISGAFSPRCPVKTEAPVPKSLMFEVMKEINNTEIKSPVRVGDVIIENVLGTGINVISAKTM